MKKIFFLLAIVTGSFSAYSQTTVFEKNKEIAQSNESKHISTITVSSFEASTSVTPAQYTELVSIMSNKDGYVSCTLTAQGKLTVTHENWMPADDIIRVMKVATIEATYTPPVEDNGTKKH